MSNPVQVVLVLDVSLCFATIQTIITWCYGRSIPFLPINIIHGLDILQRIPHPMVIVTCKPLNNLSFSFSGILHTSRFEVVAQYLDRLRTEGHTFFTRCVENEHDVCKSLLPNLTREGGSTGPTLPDLTDICYIITTSGTTSPLSKIVYVTHKSVEVNIKDLIQRFAVTKDSVLFCSSPVTFDPAVLTILLALKTSAVLVEYLPCENNKEMLEQLAKHGVTHIQTVPSFIKYVGIDNWRLLLSPATSVKVFSIGGEACLTGRELHRLCGGRREVIERISFYNIYGLTEQSVWSMLYKIPVDTLLRQSSDSIPIGESLSETRYKLADYDGGSEFKELVLETDSRLCYIDDGSSELQTSLELHTGDLVNVKDDDLFVVGRKTVDFVKIHGHRINLQRISQVIESQLDVAQVFSYHSKEHGLILAYCGDAPEDQVKQTIAIELPPAYLCQHVLHMESFPINLHGKLNRRNLIGQIEENLKLLKSSCHSQSIVHFLQKNFSNDLDTSKSLVENGASSILAVSLSQQISNLTSLTQHNVLELLLSKPLQEVVTEISRQQLLLKRESHPAIECKSPVQKKIKHDNGVKKLSPDLHTEESLIVEVIRRGSSKMFDLKSSSITTSHDWAVNTGKCVDASSCVAVIKDGLICAFIGSHSHKFYSISVMDGTILWTTELGGRIEATAEIVQDCNLIVIGCYDGCLYFLDVITGSIKWTYQMEDLIKSTPTVFKSLVYCGSHDRCLYKLDAKSRKLCWRTELDGAIYSSAVLHADFLYLSTLRGSLYQIAEGLGTVLKRLELSSPCFSSPVISNNQVIVQSVSGLVSSFNCDNYEAAWTSKADGQLFSSAIKLHVNSVDVIVFGCHDGFVYCLNATTGSLIWRALCDSTIGTIPFPYVVGNDVLVLVTCSSGSVFCIDVSDGVSTRLFTIPGPVFSSPVMVPSLLKVIIGSRDDNVYCFKYT